LVQGASDLGLHEIDEAARLVQEAVSPEANIIYGTTIDDTLGDEVRITVIAAGFDGGVPQVRRAERKPFAAAPATNSWFTTPAAAEAEAKPAVETESLATSAIDVVEAEDAPAYQAAKPQSADGTWGDDLDIPEFLR
jgi:cell division protein FtsZ